VQPLNSGEDIAIVERGTQILQLLHTHASSFTELVKDVGSAAEECEREVEQLKENEREREQETQHARTEPRFETNWSSCEKALQCKSLPVFLQKTSGTRVWLKALYTDSSACVFTSGSTLRDRRWQHMSESMLKSCWRRQQRN
jgi:hypothetical protein